MTSAIDYDAIAPAYAADRAASPRVVAHLVAGARQRGIGAGRVLELGCGTADHLAAICAALGAQGTGVDRSEGMLARGRAKHPGLTLEVGDAERALPSPAEPFALVFSVDVIHYLQDLPRFFAEAGRVLQRGGRVVTATDSHEDIPRRSMSRFFPETVAAEQARYPGIPMIVRAMGAAGLTEVEVTHTEHAGRLTPALAERYRRRAFSALRLLPDAAFEAGLRRLDAALADGTAELVEVYTYVWGRRR